ncbi:MAG TPA: universal stress protein [Solirubrobacteraceae bacterium]|nr:universal stress protein [Solirubrobacteraceae bacterium]
MSEHHDPRPVLCAVDDSPGATAAAGVAGALAVRLGARLVLVHVSADPTPGARARADQLLGAIGASAPDGVEVRARLDYGPVAARLVQAADEEGAGLLVVGARGRGPLTRAVLGSVSVEVTARARCPVCIVPPTDEDERPRARRLEGPVLCGIDGSDGAVVAARYTRVLAAALKTAVRLGHVLPADARAATPTSTGLTPLSFELVLEHEQRHALRLLDRVRRTADIPREEVSLCLARGEAAEGLNAIADQEGAGLIVVASRGRGPIHSALLGSVAATIAATGRRPTVVLSPADGQRPRWPIPLQDPKEARDDPHLGRRRPSRRARRPGRGTRL